MPFYSRCPQEVRSILDRVIDAYHPDLKGAGVTVDLLWATADGDEYPLKLHGYNCAAVISVRGAKQRALGLADAEIIIAKDRWEETPPERQFSLLDHELYHLKTEKDKFGAYKVDDYRRPILSTRMHDRQFGWFDEVARRNGDNSMERWHARQLLEEAGQLYFSLDAGRTA